MTPQSVSTLVQTHLAGRAPIRTAVPVDMPDKADVWVEPEIDLDLDLDPSYYERGTAARRRDHENLADLDDAFDEIEQRADALFDELLAVLDGL